MQGTTTVEYRWSPQNYCRNSRAAATEAQAPTHHHLGSASPFPFTFQTSCENFLINEKPESCWQESREKSFPGF